MFRNARLFRFDGEWPADEQSVSAALASDQFKPCAPLVERSSGWVTPLVDGDGLLARSVNGADLIRLRSQSRVLPHAAVNEALEQKIADYQERMAEKPSRREQRRLKAMARDELLSQALVKSERTWGYVEPALKLLVVDDIQDAKVDRFLRHFRLAFPALDVRKLAFANAIEPALNKMFLGDTPGQFAVGQECRMQDAVNTRAAVRWNHFDLADDSIRRHVADGMNVTHLALEYEHTLTFVLDDKARLSKLRFIAVDDDAASESDPLARQDAEFALFSGIMRPLLKDLSRLLGGYE